MSPSDTGAYALFATAILFTACSSDQSAPAAPQPEITVSTSVSSVTSPVVRPLVPDGVELACEVDLLSVVDGPGKGTWREGVIEFSDVRDTTKVFGTIPVPVASMKNAWGDDTIRAGQSVTSRWHVTASIAFVVVIRMPYQTANEIRTSTASARCARPSAATAAAPSVTSLAVSPSTGTIGVTTPLEVTFTANTPAGAEYSFVRATGGCGNGVIVAEFSASSVSHTLPLKLGWPCKPDVPIGVEVITYDAAGHSDRRAVATSVTMRDDQRPTVRAIFWGREWLDFLPSPYGEYLAPDTVYAEVRVRDDYLVGKLYLDVYPFGLSDTLVVRDSVVVDPAKALLPNDYTHLFRVPLRPEWAGNKLQFRYYGRDWLGNISNVYTTVSGCVRIIASSVSSPSTPNKPLYDPPCVYNPGDPAPSRIPSTPTASLDRALNGTQVKGTLVHAYAVSTTAGLNSSRTD